MTTTATSTAATSSTATNKAVISLAAGLEDSEMVTVETAELVRWGNHWLLAYDDARVVLDDLKGVGYLARLLTEPGREFHAADLSGAGTTQAGLPVLDHTAVASYRRRIDEIGVEVELALVHGDELSRVRLERERGWLAAELGRATGLGGRVRATGGTSERARTAVTRSLRYALARVTAVHPLVGRHLDRTVRTGTWCSYEPDPMSGITWRVGC